jgi:hypothetical protein
MVGEASAPTMKLWREFDVQLCKPLSVRHVDDSTFALGVLC